MENNNTGFQAAQGNCGNPGRNGTCCKWFGDANLFQKSTGRTICAWDKLRCKSWRGNSDNGDVNIQVPSQCWNKSMVYRYCCMGWCRIGHDAYTGSISQNK